MPCTKSSQQHGTQSAIRRRNASPLSACGETCVGIYYFLSHSRSGSAYRLIVNQAAAVSRASLRASSRARLILAINDV